MSRAIPLTINAGAARSLIGRHLLDRVNRDLSKVAWQGRVGYSSRRGEVKTPVQDLFTIQLLTGLVDREGNYQRSEARVPGLFFVEPAYLPMELRVEGLSSDCVYIAFSAEMFESNGKHYQWTGGVNLAEIEALAQQKEELLMGVGLRTVFRGGPAISGTMLVNLTGPDQMPRSAAELRQQISSLQQQMVRLAQA